MKSANTQQSRSAYELKRFNITSKQAGARRAPHSRASPSRPAAPAAPSPGGDTEPRPLPALRRKTQPAALRGKRPLLPAGNSVPGPLGSPPPPVEAAAAHEGSGPQQPRAAAFHTAFPAAGAAPSEREQHSPPASASSQCPPPPHLSRPRRRHPSHSAATALTPLCCPPSPAAVPSAVKSHRAPKSSPLSYRRLP